jgi:hypothetical protein
MMTENLKKLREIVLGDALLQARLQDISNADEFIGSVLEIGKSFGLELESEEVSEAMSESRRVWIERWI